MKLFRSTPCLLALLAFSGCRDRACEDGTPSLQVNLELAEQVPAAGIQSLEASVTAAGLQRVSRLDAGPLKTSGRASFVVVVGEDGGDGFEVELSVTALGIGAAIIAHAQGRFSASGDACNRFSLRLTPPAGDGGPPPDAGGADGTPGCGPANCLGCCQASGICAPGTDDTLCGNNGAACVDCSATGGTCEQGTCASCTPDCSGKACGSPDGCGGTCAAGSGCCVPPEQPCSGVCVDTTSDASHCGACNKPCAQHWLCVGGVCQCDPTASGACSTTGQYCDASTGQCAACDKGKLNCDGVGSCECIGKCSGISCDTSCTYGIPNQCGSIYHACTPGGTCELCPSGLINCDQQSGCGTPEGTPCT